MSTSHCLGPKKEQLAERNTLFSMQTVGASRHLGKSLKQSPENGARVEGCMTVSRSAVWEKKKKKGISL